MLRNPVPIVAAAALVVALSGCGRRSPVEAATPDVQGLLAAVQAGDAKGFEAHLDRAAVKADLKRQVAGVARANDLVVDGGPSDLALDKRVDVAALHVVAAGSGQPLAKPPSPAQTRALLKPIDPDHVCVRDAGSQGACVLTFAKETPGWRLVGMPAQPGVAIAVGPEPEK